MVQDLLPWTVYELQMLMLKCNNFMLAEIPKSVGGTCVIVTSSRRVLLSCW